MLIGLYTRSLSQLRALMHQLGKSTSSWGDSRKGLETPSNAAITSPHEAKWSIKKLMVAGLVDGDVIRLPAASTFGLGGPSMR